MTHFQKQKVERILDELEQERLEAELVLNPVPRFIGNLYLRPSSRFETSDCPAGKKYLEQWRPPLPRPGSVRTFPSPGIPMVRRVA